MDNAREAQWFELGLRLLVPHGLATMVQFAILIGGVSCRTDEAWEGFVGSEGNSGGEDFSKLQLHVADEGNAEIHQGQKIQRWTALQLTKKWLTKKSEIQQDIVIN